MSATTVTLNGREYLVDYASQNYQRSSIALLRAQSDQGSRPGAQSLNPEGPWRRTQESWHHGEGQTHYDRDGSDPDRFATSFGVDPWDKWSLTLLPTTVKCYTPATSVTNSLVVGDRVYIVDGTAVKFTTALSGASVWTTVTGLVGVSNIKLASDGAYVYIPQGPNGLYRVANNASAAAVWNAAATGKEAFYALGRLIITDTTTISYVPDATTVTLVATLGSGRWSDVTEGRKYIYASSSTQSSTALYGTGDGTIWRIGILADGTGLDVPAVSARLPSGEDALSIFGYEGYLMVGSSLGLRFGSENEDGTITLGSLREPEGALDGIDNGVTNAFAAQGRFVWSTYSATGIEAGLLRIDLSEFVAPLTPAAARDLVPPTGALDPAMYNSVTTCGIKSGQQFFAISGSAPGSGAGLYVTNGLRASGTLTTGRIDYGLAESKLPLYIDVQTEPLPSGASVTLSLSLDGGSFVDVGAHDVDGATSFTADLADYHDSAECRFLEIKLTLAGSSTSPRVSRVTLRCKPIAPGGEIIELPIVVAESTDIDGAVSLVDLTTELAFIRGLLNTNSLVPLVEGDLTSQVCVEDFKFVALSGTQDGQDRNGELLVRVKTFAPAAAVAVV